MRTESGNWLAHRMPSEAKKALCAACWKRWVTENASADFDDANNRSL